MSTELSTSASGRSWLEEIIWKHWFLTQGSREKLAVTDKIVLSILGLVFRPLAQIVVRVSRGRLERQVNAPSLPGIPVVAIGNWIVGGAGKTPACIAVATALRDSGHHVGIVSAGYRRDVSMDGPPLVLNEESLSQTPPAQSGDEPWLLAWRTGCPVAVHKNRLLAAQALLEAHPQTNLILLDDGLSQVTLRPDIRILVLDDRLHGNAAACPGVHFDSPGHPQRQCESILCCSISFTAARTPYPMSAGPHSINSLRPCHRCRSWAPCPFHSLN